MHVPHPGTRLATQACALTRNQTGDPSALRNDAQPTQPQQPGPESLLLIRFLSPYTFNYSLSPTNSTCKISVFSHQFHFLSTAMFLSPSQHCPNWSPFSLVLFTLTLMLCHVQIMELTSAFKVTLCEFN